MSPLTTAHLASVITAAQYVWDSPEDARDWLTRPHPELGRCTPLDSAMTELGTRRVEELLARLFYGIPA